MPPPLCRLGACGPCPPTQRPPARLRVRPPAPGVRSALEPPASHYGGSSVLEVPVTTSATCVPVWLRRPLLVMRGGAAAALVWLALHCEADSFAGALEATAVAAMAAGEGLGAAASAVSANLCGLWLGLLEVGRRRRVCHHLLWSLRNGTSRRDMVGGPTSGSTATATADAAKPLPSSFSHHCRRRLFSARRSAGLTRQGHFDGAPPLSTVAPCTWQAEALVRRGGDGARDVISDGR